MNIDTKLAEKRHQQHKQLFVNLDRRLAENRQRLETEEKLASSDIPFDKIREKLRTTELRMRQYEAESTDGWDEIKSAISNMIEEIESLFDRRDPIEK